MESFSGVLIMTRLFAYVRLMRLDRPVGTLLLAWSSLWGLWLADAGRPQQGGLYCKQLLGRIAVKLRQPENGIDLFRLSYREAPLRHSNPK